MFRTNAFGQRINCTPRLRFVDPPEGGDGGQGGGAEEVELDGEKFTFPTGTAVADMTAEQKAEYWRHQSKKQQKQKNAPADYAQLQADAAELAQLKAAQLPEQERLIAAAREEARREGENIGAEKHLKTAVRAKFQLLTGKTDDEVDTTFEHVDALSFTDDKGEIVAEKLKAFADTFGVKNDSQQQRDPVAEALARSRAAGGGTGGSSIADKRKATRESLTKTKA